MAKLTLVFGEWLNALSSADFEKGVALIKFPENSLSPAQQLEKADELIQLSHRQKAVVLTHSAGIFYRLCVRALSASYNLADENRIQPDEVEFYFQTPNGLEKISMSEDMEVLNAPQGFWEYLNADAIELASLLKLRLDLK